MSIDGGGPAADVAPVGIDPRRKARPLAGKILAAGECIGANRHAAAARVVLRWALGTLKSCGQELAEAA